MQEKKVSKVGWLPVEEKIGETWRAIEIPFILRDSLLALPKKMAIRESKTGEARKVKVTLSLKVEDV